MRSSPAENSMNVRNPFPEKLFYKIGEVSRIAGIESYVLRYWETEFPFLRPRKNQSGQRVYARKDIDTVMHIKKLLHEERYTIEGVRKMFEKSDPSRQTKIPPRPCSDDVTEKVKNRLRDILNRIR